jgi:hypothetical protein
MKQKFFIIIFFLFYAFTLSAQQVKLNDKREVKQNNNRIIKWNGIKRFYVNDADSTKYMSFEGASYKNNNVPYYYEKINAEKNYSYSVTLTDQKFAECTNEEVKLIPAKYLLKEVSVQSSINYERKIPYLCISFIPFRINNNTGKIEKLISFKIETVKKELQVPSATKKRTYASNSVLATGKWFKIAILDDGVYKITYDDLVNLGMDVSSLIPKNIRIYGNGGGMLPESNNQPRYDDLVENAIYVSGNNNSTFGKTDYILFYGESPVRWKYDTSDNKFHHQTNYYTGTTCYFITDGNSFSSVPGKRISSQASVSSPANKYITKFDDYLCHEKDSTNLIMSGKEWYGENFDILNSYSFKFSFPNIASNVKIQTDIAGRYTSDNYYNVIVNGSTLYTSHVPLIFSSDIYTFANSSDPWTDTSHFASSSNINVTITKTTSDAVGWLNYIELNASRYLALTGPQLLFRSISSVGAGNISEFAISNSSTNCRVWEVTDPLNVKEQQYTINGDSAKFRLPTDSLREFIAFNGTSYLSPTLIGKVENQNLHALGQADLIIVTYPDFISDAQRIASIHSTNDNLSYVIVTPYQIYNEFSSGSQDVSAIRDFVKMFYDRYPPPSNEMPKYLLLFGDASYDYKNRLADNTNYVPTYQNANGLAKTASYATDDFFGFLDDSEGPDGLLDIGIGRFPVKTTSDANTMVDKVNQYLEKNNPNINTNSCSNFSATVSGDWRNVVCFVADDEEGNDFFDSAEGFANYIDTTYKNYNIDKIYCDAYVQQTGAGGQRYPEVEDAINRRVEKGALIINYIGHGGELGWALERILQVPDIQSWTNIHNMPMFLTATCEFSRYDNPAQTSAGEFVLLNPNGGGIALLTTSRVAYTGSNDALCHRFYLNAFKKTNGSYPTLGDLTMFAKNSGSVYDYDIRNFVLLGDPALKLSYPVNDVITTSINGHPANTTYDTLKAFAKITVSGILQDPNGNKLTNFNGIIYPTVFDKKSQTATLGNDPTSYVANFYIQKSIIYKGKASVTNGDFSFTFIVPKDIAYNYGIGKISYYAENGSTNASGYYENKYFIVGGSKANAGKDNIGPSIKLFLNDSSFVYGGLTNEKPILIANVFDSSGINTVGNGIGHDIVATLDENTENSIVLNDYYETDLNSYQKGKISYPFSKLTDGTHTLSLKVWDIYDNPSVVTTEFVVAQSGQLALNHVLNYPNPFTTHTSFLFEHNQPCCTLDVGIQIFTVTGHLVKTINRTIPVIGYRAEPIEWDGLDDYGDPIGRGVYIYKLTVKNEEGSKAEKTEKLVILH